MNDSAHLQFVTGRLAAPALQRTVAALAEQLGFAYSIEVLPITVAALMTPAWIARRLQVRPEATQIILPGYCDGDLSCLTALTSIPIVVGPRDLRALPEFFGQRAVQHEGYGQYRVEIIAEINHAPRRTRQEILAEAGRLSAAGADLIDLGCQPGEIWGDVEDVVRSLREAGYRVSIDSFEPREVQRAVRGGAELVLSVNRTNREAALDWGCEVVVIPDEPSDLASLDETVEFLVSRQVAVRLDPILEPIGYGFGASLLRYAQTRQRYPGLPMMMGIGNVTELTDVDSAGLNVLLLALCAEWRIHSVLTTQVINWARSSVRECDLARRLVHHAVQHRVLPKHLETQLILLRDERLYELEDDDFQELATTIRDANYRLFAQRGELHLLAARQHLHDPDPYQLFEQLMATHPKNLDLSHVFYLGYELSKAHTALTLHKQYRQDEALDWGFLTVAEKHRRTGP